VDPQVYKTYGQTAWKFLNPNALEALDIMREVFGPLYINDWKWGGDFTESGLRSPTSHVGSVMSAHRRGCAFDVKSKKYSADEIRAWFKQSLKDGHRVTELVNEVELGTETWTHIAKVNRKDFKWIRP